MIRERAQQDGQLASRLAAPLPINLRSKQQQIWLRCRLRCGQSFDWYSRHALFEKPCAGADHFTALAPACLLISG